MNGWNLQHLKDDSQTDLCSDPAAPGIQLSENSSVVPHLVFRDGNPNPVLPSRSPAFFFDHGIDLRSVGQGRPGQVRSPLASRWRQCSVGFDVGKHSVNYILFLLATMGSSKHISILGTKKKLFQVKLNDITSCYLSEAILVKASLVKQGTTPQTCSNPKRFTWIPCLLPWKLGKASVASLKHIFWPTCASYCCSDVWWSFARFECLKNIRVVQLEEKH